MCSGPELVVAVTGPHSANLTVTPPAYGDPFDHYDVKICLKSDATACFTVACPAAAANAATTCTTTAAECLPPATNCLRAETKYTAVATAVKADSTTSLESSPADEFETPSHRQAVSYCFRLMPRLVLPTGRGWRA